MPVTKEDIVTALQKLDSGNAEHWTDDGLPRVDVVRALANDTAVTRSDINKAAPGFSQATMDGTGAEPPDVLPGELSAEAEKAALNGTDDAPEVAELTGELSKEELKEAMKARIDRAEVRIEAARKAIRESQLELRKAEQIHTRAVQDFNSRFPPLSAAQAIKDHLRRQAEHQINQLDNAMAVRGKRGWQRPSHL